VEGMMSIYSFLFRFTNAQTINSINASIAKLRLGIFALLMKKYLPEYGEEKSKLLGAAVLNEATLEKPGNRAAKSFYQENSELIEEEAKNIVLDDKLPKAFSYLYAALTYYFVFTTGKPISKKSEKLGERATDLYLYIPNTYDICGSGDAKECINAISEFAEKFVAENIKLYEPEWVAADKRNVS
jgi:hypothetical protein